VKGVHTLVDAFKRLPADVRAELVVHGLPGDAGYEQMVRGMAAGERRIRIGDPVGREDVLTVLAGFDVLAVPSLWMETGPLVMLEASAAGIPVLGSDLGGIVELVEAGVTGRLLPAGDVDAWSRALAELAATPPALRFPQPSRPPRSMHQIAEDMSAMYREVIGVESMRLSALR
jgi:glycosyltransferase involved in cell wall biosynthesis